MSCCKTIFRRIIHIDRMEVCGGTANYSLQMKYIHYFNPVGDNTRVNLAGELLHDHKSIDSSADIVRCLNKEYPDTCIPFLVWKPVKTTCNYLFIIETPGLNIKDSVHPALTCPLRAGNYTMTNGTFDPETFIFFPIEDYYWKVKWNFTDQNDYITYCVEGTAYRYRNKQ